MLVFCLCASITYVQKPNTGRLLIASTTYSATRTWCARVRRCQPTMSLRSVKVTYKNRTNSVLPADETSSQSFSYTWCIGRYRPVIYCFLKENYAGNCCNIIFFVKKGSCMTLRALAHM